LTVIVDLAERAGKAAEKSDIAILHSVASSDAAAPRSPA
jgi:hypothetical protein